jgi:hypothetical protein
MRLRKDGRRFDQIDRVAGRRASQMRAIASRRARSAALAGTAVSSLTDQPCGSGADSLPRMVWQCPPSRGLGCPSIGNGNRSLNMKNVDHERRQASRTSRAPHGRGTCCYSAGPTDDFQPGLAPSSFGGTLSPTHPSPVEGAAYAGHLPTGACPLTVPRERQTRLYSSNTRRRRKAE